MPFLDDAGVRDEPRGPIWDAFAVLAGEVERLIVVNIAWALSLTPAVLALAFPAWPSWLRFAMLLLSATTLAPATAALYGLAALACRRDHLSLQVGGDLVRRLALPGLRTLAPLAGTFGVLIWAGVALRGLAPGLDLPAALVVCAGLLWLVCATYWGPMLAADPARSILDVARRSASLAWRYPSETLATVAATALAFLVGVVSIGGVVLVAPVLIAILQTARFHDLTARPHHRESS